MKVFTLAVVMAFFATTICYGQGTTTKTTGVPATTGKVVKTNTPSPSSPAADIWSIDFEDEIEWTFDFDPWIAVDEDGLNTYGFTSYTFPHMFEPMAYIVFNPATTTPPMTGDPDIQPHSGAQFGACMASVPSGGQGNDDWFISDQIALGTGASFTFWAKSYVDTYGLERFNVGVSTTGTNPSDFTIISTSPYLEAPTTWTEYTFDLSAYAGEDVHVAIQCVSYDAFVFMIDDLVVDPGAVPMDCDDFDSYTAGQLLCPQSTWWTTWSGNPGGPDDAYVTDAEYLTPPNSLVIDLAVMESDVVHDLMQMTTGRWEISLDLLVPTGASYGAYYNVMQDMVLFGTANEWGFQVYFSSAADGYMYDAAFNRTDFFYTMDEWIHCEVIVDLDNAWAEFWIDGTLINEWQWDIDGPNMLGAIDIYAAAPGSDDPFFFVDNVCYIELPPVGIDPGVTERPGIRLFPNPASSFLNITSSDPLFAVQIFNTVGQTVYSGNVKGNTVQINTETLEAGLYIVQIRTENGFETKKFMKK